jgi:hypothetical protein
LYFSNKTTYYYLQILKIQKGPSFENFSFILLPKTG